MQIDFENDAHGDTQKEAKDKNGCDFKKNTKQTKPHLQVENQCFSINTCVELRFVFIGELVNWERQGFAHSALRYDFFVQIRFMNFVFSCIAIASVEIFCIFLSNF